MGVMGPPGVGIVGGYRALSGLGSNCHAFCTGSLWKNPCTVISGPGSKEKVQLDPGFRFPKAESRRGSTRCNSKSRLFCV
jgi:hypothetical protein